MINQAYEAKLEFNYHSLKSHIMKKKKNAILSVGAQARKWTGSSIGQARNAGSDTARAQECENIGTDTSF